MNNKYIVCMKCFSKDDHRSAKVLGVLDTNGDVLIQRFHNGVTRIKSNDYSVVCNECGSNVYIHKNNVLNDNFSLLSMWESFYGTAHYGGTL